MFEALKNPAYVHVLLNPLPVYATASGLAALLLGVILRHRAVQGVALFLILIGTASVWPVMETGDDAIEQLHNQLDADSQHWVHSHEERADQVAWIFFVTAALAAAAMVALWKFPKAACWLVTGAILATIASLLAGAWISRAGGQIRHTEFRH